MGVAGLVDYVRGKGASLPIGLLSLAFGFSSLRRTRNCGLSFILKGCQFGTRLFKRQIKFWGCAFGSGEKALSGGKTGNLINCGGGAKHNKVLTLDRIEGTVEHGEEGFYVFSCECKVCKNRILKKFSRKAYNEGVVIVRCDKCRTLHLVSDKLGWFADK
ncbi:hypothetical protein FG386_001123 [Cryptosporidium ryanae]|uniref:uncharacterized protein n=1 Tax=Cryptosporidium ryanae TaxID=515981 RepID=UPI00351AA9A5|nr:hypothetical protein FG386_001123 [Cryptosporidium ryanae]